LLKIGGFVAVFRNIRSSGLMMTASILCLRELDRPGESDEELTVGAMADGFASIWSALAGVFGGLSVEPLRRTLAPITVNNMSPQLLATLHSNLQCHRTTGS